MRATYVRRMRNNNLEIRIAGSSCLLQLLYLVINVACFNFLLLWKCPFIDDVQRIIKNSFRKNSAPPALLRVEDWL